MDQAWIDLKCKDVVLSKTIESILEIFEDENVNYQLLS